MKQMSEGKVGLFSTLCLSLGTMIGSGWLFASYYAAKSAGPGSIFSWIIGAGIVLAMAFMLAQIACVYQDRGLFTKLTTISHGTDFGFITAISNWLVGIIIVPSEAIATVQFISTIYPDYTDYLFQNHQFTALGIVLVSLLLFVFLLLNYWGIKLLVRFNNSLTLFKIALPIVTIILIFMTAFHPENFRFGNIGNLEKTIGFSEIKTILSTIVTSGIFYAFFGFQTAVSFASELKNPKRSIPIALISCVLIVLVIYLFLQISFIGALPTEMLAQGWSNIHFASPLAELSVLLGLNFLALILYVDACISPSGTGIIYLGASTRMLTAMSQHGQVPGYFSKITKYQISRRSLLCTFILCLTVVIFFRNWQSIAVLTTTFILVSCFALTISYARLLVDKKITEASFKLKGGALVAFLVFLFLNYLFTGLPTLNIIIMLILNFTLFGVYTILQSRNNWALVLTKIKNTWSIFLYFIYLLLFAWLNGIYPILSHSIISAFISYLIIPAALFFSMVYQKNHDAGPERGTVN